MTYDTTTITIDGELVELPPAHQAFEAFEEAAETLSNTFHHADGSWADIAEAALDASRIATDIAEHAMKLALLGAVKR